MHLLLPWLHLLSKGNHAHPRFNCIYILSLFSSTYKRSYLLLIYVIYGFNKRFCRHPFHITFFHSRRSSTLKELRTIGAAASRMAAIAIRWWGVSPESSSPKGPFRGRRGNALLYVVLAFFEFTIQIL